MSNRLTIFVSLTFLLSLSLAVQGQEHDQRKAIGYGFVSPNLREDLKLEEAINNLHSVEENQLIREARYVACRVKVAARINRSLGHWADGAENSLILRMYADESTVRYAAASLGKSWHQKTVLYFRRQTSGPSRMYVISVLRRNRGRRVGVGTVTKALDDAGVAYRTLVLVKTRVLIYVVDLSNGLQLQVQSAARQLRSPAASFAGTGGFIGNDTSRDQAQEVFDKEIKSYEAHHSLNNLCANDSSRRRRARQGNRILSANSALP